MQISCNDIDFLTRCAYPNYPRIQAPAKVILWWVRGLNEELIGNVSSLTARAVKAGGAKAYHYVVAPNAITGLVPPQYLAYNFASPSDPVPTLDEGLIHVALTGWANCTELDSKNLFDAVASLVCCLKDSFPSVQIFLPSDIQVGLLDEDEHPQHVEKPEFAELLRTVAADCEVFRNERQTLLSEDALGQMRNAQLSASNFTSSLDPTCQTCGGGCGCVTCQSVTIGCCGNHSTDYPGSACDACAVLADQQAELTALRQQVADMLIEFGKFQTWRQIWEPRIQAITPTVEALKLDVDGLRMWAASAKDCLDCLCKTVSYSDPIEYMIDPAKPLQNCFTPNVNKWLQFPLRISDLNPAAVRLGALWSANLPGNKYDIALNLELPPINYCNGCKVWVEQVACGVRTRVYEQSMMAGLQPLTINWTGQIVITSPCPDLHYELGTDTNLGMPAQYCVESGSISFTPCTNF